MLRRAPSDAEWVDSRVQSLPPRWQGRLRRAWERRHPTDPFGANVELRETTNSLIRVRVPLDASDQDICDAAVTMAARCWERATVYRSTVDIRRAVERVCEWQGIKPPPADVRVGPAIARMCCSQWWRRKLRCHQGQTVEAAAVRLGYVNKMRDLYISEERLAARKQQNARNAAMLEATIACNESGQEFTLAQLAATSTANKSVRRAELMTRIAGFERIANDMGHDGVFLTITCPSRFHRFTTVNGGSAVVPNKHYDSRETPRTGQHYLARLWTHIRANLARNGIQVYGFRIAEPQHDGTPHWHLLLFTAADQVNGLVEVVKKHALKDSPDEKGAATHRFDVKLIDRSLGSAAGYIAKYVAKNIDGEHVGEDFNGKPATETAKRVEAWATTWRIRQFQQIGGPPVNVWRELRRIAGLPAGAPKHLQDAHKAVNKLTLRADRDTASVAWDAYCQAQGGVFCGRKARIKLAMRPTEGLGQYGDPIGPRPFGVETTSLESHRDPAGLAPDAVREIHWTVESERHDWSIQKRKRPAVAEGDLTAGLTQSVQPWTSVNNCTEVGATESPTSARVDGDVNPITCLPQETGVLIGNKTAEPRKCEGGQAGRVLHAAV